MHTTDLPSGVSEAAIVLTLSTQTSASVGSWRAQIAVAIRLADIYVRWYNGTDWLDWIKAN